MVKPRESAAYAGWIRTSAIAADVDTALAESSQNRDPLLVGAEQIARYLSPPAGIGPPITEKQIYRMREAGAPIGKVPGLGIAVRISTLDAYLRDHGA